MEDGVKTCGGPVAAHRVCVWPVAPRRLPAPGTRPVRTTTQEPVDDAAAWSRAAVAALPDDVRPTVRVHRAATERRPGQPHLPGGPRTIAGVGRKRRGRAVGAPAVTVINRGFARRAATRREHVRAVWHRWNPRSHDQRVVRRKYLHRRTCKRDLAGSS